MHAFAQCCTIPTNLRRLANSLSTHMLGKVRLFSVVHYSLPLARLEFAIEVS